MASHDLAHVFEEEKERLPQNLKTFDSMWDERLGETNTPPIPPTSDPMLAPSLNGHTKHGLSPKNLS